MTTYHIEAAIAAEHAMARCFQETDWSRIVHLYDALLQLQPSPVIALNRAVAVARRDGAKKGLEELVNIEDLSRLATYPFFFAALGELELQMGRVDAARLSFDRARVVARNPAESAFLTARRNKCGEVG